MVRRGEGQWGTWFLEPVDRTQHFLTTHANECQLPTAKDPVASVEMDRTILPSATKKKEENVEVHRDRHERESDGTNHTGKLEISAHPKT